MRREPSAHEVTVLLRAWGEENKEVLDRVTPVVCRELPFIAKRLKARDRLAHLLQATALFDEIYWHLVDVHQVNRPERPHSPGIRTRTRRRFRVDYARIQGNMKRGSGKLSLEIKEGLAAESSADADFLEVDDAPKRLAEIDPRQGQGRTALSKWSELRSEGRSTHHSF